MCLTCSLLALGREAKLWRQCFMRLEPKPHPILVSLPKSWTLSSCLLVINSLSSETCDSSKGREGMTWKLIRGTVLKWCCKMEMRPLEERDCTWEICKPRWKQRKGGEVAGRGYSRPGSQAQAWRWSSHLRGEETQPHKPRSLRVSFFSPEGKRKMPLSLSSPLRFL